MRMLGSGVSLVLLCLTLSCGYALVGKGSFLPPHTRKLAVPPFADRTGWPKLAQTVTRTVSERLIRQAKTEIVTKEAGADAVLRGEILRVDQQPIAFKDGYASTYQVTITAGVKLRDLIENKDIYANPSFVFRSEYDVEQDFRNFFDSSEESVEEIAVDFADQLIVTILEGF